ncbi:MAG: hypothetical protein AAGJ50_15425 [Pseudomonadota bacterium]
MAGLGIFTAGFVLGVIRTVWLVPRLPEWQAVLIEGPFILVLSWFILQYFVRRRAISVVTSTRLAFGASALVTLWVCEWITTVTLMGEDPSFFFHRLVTLPGAMGLAAQMLIIVMPLWMTVRESGQDP